MSSSETLPTESLDAESWSQNALRLFAKARQGAEAPPEAQIVAVNSADELEYARIPSGEFWMGAAEDDQEARPQERPRHLVRLPHSFWLSRTPVTVDAYRLFATATGRPMPSCPVFNREWAYGDHPIVSVSHADAAAYCAWAGGRLPTEAEWEYVATALGANRFPWGDDVEDAKANYGRAIHGTTPVQRFPANELGLYDLAGNTWEWCHDWYGPYSGEEQTNPTGAERSNARVLRGGCWLGDWWSLRCTSRARFPPDATLGIVGFRCVWLISPSQD